MKPFRSTSVPELSHRPTPKGVWDGTGHMGRDMGQVEQVGQHQVRGGIGEVGQVGQEAVPSGVDCRTVPRPLIDQDAFAAELEERLRTAVEQTVRARMARRDAQTEFRRRRAYGLNQRHAAKLERNHRDG